MTGELPVLEAPFGSIRTDYTLVLAPPVDCLTRIFPSWSANGGPSALLSLGHLVLPLYTSAPTPSGLIKRNPTCTDFDRAFPGIKGPYESTFGKLATVIAPTITVTIEITMATIGRLMKNFDMPTRQLSKGSRGW